MIPHILPLIVACFAWRNIAQTITPTATPTPIEIKPTPVDEACVGCSLAPATTDTTIFNATASKKESFLIFTSYYIASQYLSQGVCQLDLGSLVPVNPFFSVLQPATVNSTEFQSTAIESFVNHLGFSSCSVKGAEVSVDRLSTLPVVAVITTPTTSGPSPLTTTPPSPKNSSTQPVPTFSSGSHSKKVEIGNAIAFPVAFLVLSLLGYVAYKRRKIKKTLTEEDATLQQGQVSPQENNQPYLQQKSELEAEENRKHELEARERRYEMGIEGERHELPVKEEGNSMIRTRQELRGEEHSKELDVSH